MNEIITAFLFNVTACVFGLVLVLTLRHVYYVPARFMYYRFGVFALRDKLGRLVCEHKLDETSDIYAFHIKYLNDSIRCLEQIDLASLVKWRLEIEKNDKFLKQFQETVEKTRTECPEALGIMQEYEKIMLDAIRRNSWVLRHHRLSRALIAVLSIVSNSLMKHGHDRLEDVVKLPDMTKQRLANVGLAVTG